MNLLRNFKYSSIFQEILLGSVFKKVCLKVLRLLVVKLEAVVARFLSRDVSDQGLLLSLAGFSVLKEILQALRGERPPFFGTLAKKEIVFLIRKKFPQLERQIIEEADRICSHIFDLLGSGPVNLDEFVEQHGGKEKCGYLPWHFDFKTSYKWSRKKYYKEIRPAYGKADIKVPWELSRFLHVAALGQAYWLTGNEKYSLEFVRQVENWINHNPPKFGVNWACTMDVAIRLANWVLGFYFFKESPTLTDGFLTKFLKSLLIHGRHIISNLENKGITNNHYLANLVGLIYLGIAFPEFKEAKKWLEFGLRELAKEMDKQVYDDGMDFESSTCYHRLALELFFYPAILCKINDIELPQAFIGKLKKMFDFVLYVLKPNGRMPQIGDNDNGHLHVFYRREILDMTYLLTFAALLYKEPAYKIKEFGFSPEALWVFGPDAYERWARLPGRSVEDLESRAFLQGGVYVMRHKKDYMVVSCGPNGQGGVGGHAHNDKLSFELCIGGKDIVIDPGTYHYTSCPKWRDMFRSTGYHNTVMVDGQEQNPLEEGKIFSLPDFTRCRCLAWQSELEKEVFIGEHRAYLRLEQPIVHWRKVEFFKSSRTWMITDGFYQPLELYKEYADRRASPSNRVYLLKLNIHLAPGILVDIRCGVSANNAFLISSQALERSSSGSLIESEVLLNTAPNVSGKDAILNFHIIKDISLIFYLFCGDHVIAEARAWGWSQAENETGWSSPEYGRKEESKVVLLQAQCTFPVVLHFVVKANRLTSE